MGLMFARRRQTAAASKKSEAHKLATHANEKAKAHGENHKLAHAAAGNESVPHVTSKPAKEEAKP